MATDVHFGQIVWARVADANGVEKLRPAVVVTTDERISGVEWLDVIAITSQIPPHVPDDHVLLPWHRQGYPRTGLKRKCAAVCSWLARIRLADIDDVAGTVPGAEMHAIMERIAKRQDES